MTDDDPRLEMIKSNAAFVIAELGPLSGFDFGLDRASVAWVEGFIERQRGAADGPESNIVSVLGSYLGEAIIAAAGGRWDETEQGNLGVRFDNGDWCFPFAKVAKQFAGGLEDGESILSFYNVSADIANRDGASALSGWGSNTSGNGSG